MKKQVAVLLSCLFLLTGINQAQLRIGIAGGPQLSSVPGNPNPGWDTLQYNHSKRQGWRAGLLADMRLGANSPIYVQSGMFFSNKGQRFTLKYDSAHNGVTEVKGLQYVNYMEVPLNIVLKLDMGKKAKFFIGGGGYAGFLFTGKERIETRYQNGTTALMQNTDLKVTTAPGTYSNIEYGWNASTGVEIGRFIVSANYSQGLTDFYSSNAPDVAFKHRAMSAAVGYYIFYGKDKVRNKHTNDQDDDGVPDNEDACPNKPGTAATKGCPDSDLDGIADKVDKCPELAGIAKYNGCPVPDRDKDGINDEEDKCPDVAGVKQYQGCLFPDKDNDGVPDHEDKCPEVTGSKNFKGCPAPDTDKDGVNDDDDKCPGTKGSTANKGCPDIKKELVDKVEHLSRRIHFKYKSILLLPASKKVLDELVKILKANPELNVSIEGHASQDGNPANHEKLSHARAYSVKVYFESKGISPFRLKVVAHGASKPLLKGFKERALSANRRVEIKLSNPE